MATSRTSFRVTVTYDLKIDTGEIPAPVVQDLIEQQAVKYPPSLNLGDGDYFAGEGSDYGDATVVEANVEVLS